MQWLRKIFSLFLGRKHKFICGGIGHIDVVDNLGRIISQLYFNRPDSDMRLNYTYKYQDISSHDEHLREIDEDKKKGGDSTKKIHQIIERDLFLPEAENIFSHSKGYLDSDNEIIDFLPKEKQFEILKKYWRHHLVSMVSLAYEDASNFKKKF